MGSKIYIGVAWPYANGSLHLGHIAGCYLPADIFARYNRLRGHQVLMVSGSDEHGTPITITADKEKTTPQQIVDRYHKEHALNMQQLGISFDLFTRTTTKNHEQVVQHVFTTLLNNGHIYKKSIDAFYCESCDRFLPDRYVEGVCPSCHTDGARGDQCDHCGCLLNTFELEHVKCKLCGGTPVVRSTEHFFFALSKFEKKLLSWLEEKQYWKPNVLRFTENWLKGGLEDRAISRDMLWGVPIPLKGFENKRLYVWFDAVIGYLAASKEWAQKKGIPDAWEHFWKDASVRHYYFLAKDNIPFHSIIWPSMLMGYDPELNLPYDIPANEYLLLKGEQFSKSRKVAIWVPDILKKLDSDAIRYYLSINMPEQKDTNWLWQDFVAKNNDELVGAYGNFVHRVLTFTNKNYGSIPLRNNTIDADAEVTRQIQMTGAEVADSLERCSFKKGLRAAMNLAQFGNMYFDQNQPWTLISSDRDRCGTVLHECLRLIQALCVFMEPFLPFSSERIWRLLGNTEKISCWEDAFCSLKEGVIVEKPNPVFKKVELHDVVEASDPFSKLDLRVAKIIAVHDHPQADKLYLFDVDLGPLGKRTIVAGIKPYYPKETLVGRSIVMVVNLKPAKIRGIESKGMLLAADDGAGIVSLLVPRQGDAGAEVFVEGIAREPVPVLEFDDFKQVSMSTDEQGHIMYNGKPVQTKNDVIVSDKTIKPGAEVH